MTKQPRWVLLRAIARIGLVALLTAGLSAAVAAGDPKRLDLSDNTRMRIGVGDRLSVLRGERWVATLDHLDRLDLRLDLLQIWLTKGWRKDWLERGRLEQLVKRGITPVVVHYYFGDEISRERVESQRDAWYSSMWEMAQALRMDTPVLVILEPEFNNAPPQGETAITSWPGFADDLRAAAKMIREQAPNVLVGTCPGDFPGTPQLEPVLGPVASDLDFIAFQEMRGATDPDAGRAGYLDVGTAAVDYARYLKRAFGRPILFGYLAVSSYQGWENPQRDALADVLAQRRALREAGVWGLVYFQLFDDPAHRGYFGPGERHFGLLSHQGRKKPALEVFRALTR